MSLKISDLNALNSVTVGATGFTPKLLVEGSNSSGLAEIYVSAGSGNTLRLNTNFANGNYIDINPYITGVSNGGFSISQSGTPRLVITASGNVGIGTTTDAGYKLDVSGTSNITATPGSYGIMLRLRDTVVSGTESFAGVHFTSSPGTDYTIGKWSTAAGAGLLQIRDQAGNKFFTINGGGYVGVGCSTMFDKLTLGGGKFYISHTANSDIGGAIYSYNDSGYQTYAGGLRFQTFRAESSGYLMYDAMTIDAAGRVGIAKTNPTSTLDVNGTGYFNGTITNTSNAIFGSGANRSVTYDSNGGNFRIKANTGGWATGYFLDGSSGTFRGGFGGYGDYDSLIYHWIGSDYNVPTITAMPNQGNVMIGTTTDSGYKLNVYRDADVWHTVIGGASGQLRIGGQTSSGAVIQAYTPGGTTRNVYLQRDGGNVLINTTTDSGFRLDVNGTVRSQGALTVSNNAIFGGSEGSQKRFVTIGLNGADYQHRYILLAKYPTFGASTVNAGFRGSITMERVNGIGIDVHDEFDFTVYYGNAIEFVQTSYQSYQTSLVQLSYGGTQYLALYVYSAPGYSVAYMDVVQTNYGGWLDGNTFVAVESSSALHSSVSYGSNGTIIKQPTNINGTLTVTPRASAVGMFVNHGGSVTNPAAKFNSAGSGNTYGANTVTIDGCNYGSGLKIVTNLWSASQQAVQFTGPTTTVGSITCTTSATSYNTSSDYRLKENIVPIESSIIRLKELNPCRFNFINNPNNTVDGFIAHEVQQVIPEAVTGEKDELEYDGSPKYQGIDQSKLVPLLTAALQEAILKIEELENRLSILENN